MVVVVDVVVRSFVVVAPLFPVFVVVGSIVVVVAVGAFVLDDVGLLPPALDNKVTLTILQGILNFLTRCGCSCR